MFVRSVMLNDEQKEKDALSSGYLSFHRRRLTKYLHDEADVADAET